MKASLLFLATVVSVAFIAAVNAAPRTATAPYRPTPSISIDATSICGPVSRRPRATRRRASPPTANARTLVMKAGWTSAETRWYCSSVHFKT